MTQTYRLHYVPDNASLIIRLALLELDQPFEAILVDRVNMAHKKAEYLALNPAGRIPALETPDGVLFETGAILLWLAERHGALFPAPGSADRGQALKWLFYVSNTLHANLNIRFYPDQFTSTAEEPLRDGAAANISHCFSLLDEIAGGNHSWINGADLSILDLYICATLRWAQIYPAKDYGNIKAVTWPNLYELAQRVEKRASVKALVDAEGQGETPFSNPSSFYSPQHLIA